MFVSWNIKYARDIDGAIETFQNTPELANADVILLQEMDLDGVDAISQALQLNYVYYPASVHPNTGRDFGEAILSPWPLYDDAKVILPHGSIKNGQIRIAARTYVQIPDAVILAYSVHTETALLSPSKRRDQVDVLLDDVSRDVPYVVIGGDFNTVTPLERNALLKMMADSDFIWATRDAGATVREAGFGLIMDYIFVRGMEEKDAGAIDSEASDHLPLWAITRISH